MIAIGHPDSGSYSTRFSEIQYIYRLPSPCLIPPNEDLFPPGFTLTKIGLITAVGFSGGPVINLNREVIGVHMASFRVVGFESYEVPNSYVVVLMDWLKTQSRRSNLCSRQRGERGGSLKA